MAHTVSRSLALVALVASATACASMLRGPEQTVRIHCNPAQDVGALVDGEELPFEDGTIQLSKTRDAHFVTFTKGGYRSSTLAFNRQVDPVWLLANLIWGPAFPIGWFVDWSTSSIYRIDPQDMHVLLTEEDTLAIE